MDRLTQKDLSGVLAVLREIYAAPDPDTLVGRLLDPLARLTASDIATYNEYNPSRRRIRYVIEPAAAEPPGGQALHNELLQQHPLVLHYQKTGDLRGVAISDLLSRQQYRRLAIYNEFFRYATPAVEDLIGLTFTKRFNAGVALARAGRNYSERERLILNLIRPHLAQAYGNAERVAALRSELDAARGALEALNRGVIVLDSRGRAKIINERARNDLAQYYGPLRRRLPRELESWISHQLKLFDPKRDFPAPSRPLTIERDSSRLAIRMVRSAGANTLLVLEERRTGPDPSYLRALGLTRRESEVTSLIAKGQANKEIARLLGMAPNTVEKHLERIYVKLGVNTRTAAAARALDAA